MPDINITIDREDIEVEVTATHWGPAEPDAGIPYPYIEEYAVYVAGREFTDKGYDQISASDDERILLLLEETGDNCPYIGSDPDAYDEDVDEDDYIYDTFSRDK